MFSEAPIETESNDPAETTPDEGECAPRDNPKIAQLTAALAQMSAERAKMQETFQADRKKLKTELESEVIRLKAELEESTTKNTTLTEELKQGEIRLRDSVRVMEAENSASKIANRELQERVDNTLFPVFQKNRKFEKNPKIRIFPKINTPLQKQLNQERKNRDAAEEDSKKKSEVINSLKSELKDSHEVISTIFR